MEAKKGADSSLQYKKTKTERAREFYEKLSRSSRPHSKQTGNSRRVRWLPCHRRTGGGQTRRQSKKGKSLSRTTSLLTSLKLEAKPSKPLNKSIVDSFTECLSQGIIQEERHETITIFKKDYPKTLLITAPSACSMSFTGHILTKITKTEELDYWMNSSH